MTYRLSELPLLLGCTFEEARAWVRALETGETVERDARRARLVTPAQLERIAAARMIASNRKVSRVAALHFVARLDAAFEALRWLEVSRGMLGVTALEARIAALEQVSFSKRQAITTVPTRFLPGAA